jgi:hypothetical protein
MNINIIINVSFFFEDITILLTKHENLLKDIWRHKVEQMKQLFKIILKWCTSQQQLVTQSIVTKDTEKLKYKHMSCQSKSPLLQNNYTTTDTRKLKCEM